jgi:threonyl-tRNA synthetase
LADFGVLHRNEASGALGGLTRVRKFHQDDAHIFCREDQIGDEILSSLEFLNYIYDIFGFQYSLELSTRPEKYLGTLEQWASSEKALSEALDKSGRPWSLNPGDGAFYGPKIDIKVLDCYKRKHQLGTIQLDFNLPQRFNLQYKEKDAETENDDNEGDTTQDNSVNKQGKDHKHKHSKKEEHPKDHEHPLEQDLLSEDALKKMTEEEKYSIIRKVKTGFKRPVIVHRAILGSLERCIAILCEHFGGKWPFWLSPRQIVIIPVSAKYNGYAEKLKNRLTVEGYFVDVENSNLTLNKRIRNSQLEQYNVIIVAGEKEENSKTVAIRYRDSDKVEADVKISQLMQILRDLHPKPSKAELQFKENSLYGDDELKH